MPTTLNVSSLDLLHPELVRLDADTSGRCPRPHGCLRLDGLPADLDVRPVPAARSGRALGEHVAWAESNAIVFANSVLGARTDRYGDFIDICCAITGRAPAAGLHLDERTTRPRRVQGREACPSGCAATRPPSPPSVTSSGARPAPRCRRSPGFPRATTEDQLKALGAAAASSGAVAMFHAVGVTPEAPTPRRCDGRGPDPPLDVTVDLAALRAARDELSTVEAGAAVGSVSLGTPHCSAAELGACAELVRRRARSPSRVYVNTGRDVLAQRSPARPPRRSGTRASPIVTDTCTYITPIIERAATPVVTNSGKWAWYAPGNLGFDVAFATLEECVDSAVAGRLVRDDGTWGDGEREPAVRAARPGSRHR